MIQCIFCSQNVHTIDYKDVETLNRFLSQRGKIKNPKHTHLCSTHQRRIARSVKQARNMALLPFERR